MTLKSIISLCIGLSFLQSCGQNTKDDSKNTEVAKAVIEDQKEALETATIKTATIEYQNQTDYNMAMFQEYKLQLQKVDSIYNGVIKKYQTLDKQYKDEEWINYSKAVKSSLKESHKTWKISLEKDAAYIQANYEGGSMAGGVVNQNRVIQVKARIAFYELLN